MKIHPNRKSSIIFANNLLNFIEGFVGDSFHEENCVPHVPTATHSDV